jgi:hypothetical protein
MGAARYHRQLRGSNGGDYTVGTGSIRHPGEEECHVATHSSETIRLL